MLITDINTAGASGLRIKTSSDTGAIIDESERTLVNIAGAFNGGSVTVERYIASADTWLPVVTFTENAFVIIETVRQEIMRTNTTHGGSAPSLTCDITFPVGQYGSVEAV